MKVTGMDFASDLARCLHKRVSSLPGGDRSEIIRFLNFPNNSISIKISWNSIPIGQVNARIVEEPQDYYLRGAFFPADGSQPTGFTLRPGKDYLQNLESFVETIAFACIGASFSASPPSSQPTQQSSQHHQTEKAQFFEPGPDFPFSDPQPQQATKSHQPQEFFQPGDDFPFSDSPLTQPQTKTENTEHTSPPSQKSSTQDSNSIVVETVVLKPLEE
ncbi:MAG: hypothetical protein N2035_09710 [Chthoniobacterales bacterium]|nr:hypothetical protein [Chthoniobacterales bacterium]